MTTRHIKSYLGESGYESSRPKETWLKKFSAHDLSQSNEKSMSMPMNWPMASRRTTSGTAIGLVCSSHFDRGCKDECGVARFVSRGIIAIKLQKEYQTGNLLGDNRLKDLFCV